MNLQLNFFNNVSRRNIIFLRYFGFLAVFVAISVSGWGQSTYNLCTSTTDLVAGAKYIVVSAQSGSGYALGLQNANNRAAVSVTISSSSISATPATTTTDIKPFEITLGGSSGSWTLFDAVNSGFLYAASSSANYLRNQTTSTTWTISFSSNAAVLTSAAQSSRNTLRYNLNTPNDPLFSCYTSSSVSAVYLYKKVETNTPTITITETSLSGFTYVQGSGPSTEQTFKVSGSNLTNEISIAATTNYEISKTSGSGYTTPLTFAPSSGNVAESNVYVRLKSGLTANNYNSEVINITSSGASAKTVTCSGSVTSSPVTPAVSIQLTSGTNPTCTGSSVTFTATPTNTGGGTVAYQWKINGSNAGTNSSTFTTTTLINNDQVTCVINITGGNVTSNTATSSGIDMTINALPTTPTAGNNGPICAGGTLNLTSNATGTISWTGPNSFTSNQQNPTITNVTNAAAGTYYVTSNDGTCSSVAGSTVVTINSAPAFTTHPASVNKTVGSSHTFTVVATGAGLSYQWKLNGNDISGAIGDSYTVSNVTLAMSGDSYSVVVTGTCSPTITSNPAILTVVELPCGGTESFTNSTISGSYSSGSFTGDIVSWSYVYCRDESTYGINGKGCMLGSSNTAKLTSGSLSGIGNFTCKLKKGFTGAGSRQVGLYINNVLKGTSIAWDNTTTQTFTVNNINVTGNVVIEIRNLTNFQAVVDDISWTCYAPPSTPIANDALNVSTTSFDANWNAVSGAASYKLDVANQSNFTSDVTLIDENFVNCPIAISTDISGSLNTYLNLNGWTGSQIYGYGGYLRLGSGSSRGIITTPTLNLSNAESVTLSFDLGEYGTDGSTIEIFHAADGVTFNSVTTIAALSTIANQIVSITGGTADSKIRIQAITDANERYYLDNFKVVKTVSNCIDGYKDLTVNALTQAVTGLTNHTNYYYRVHAVGANGTSENSNVIMVYTGENYRSKTNGNWNELSTWETSADNTTWVDATVLPSETSSTVTVQSGNEVEIIDNTIVKTIIVNPNGKLTLNNTKTLTAAKMIIESNATNGTGTYVDKNLYPSPQAPAAVSGEVHQDLRDSRSWYLASPITGGAKADLLSANSYIYNEPNNTWDAISGSLTPGKGYYAQSPSGDLTFTGTLNNGPISVSLTRRDALNTNYSGFNLVGNPYPSHIIWTTDKAQESNVLSSIWYRTAVFSSTENKNIYSFESYNADGTISVPVTATPYIPPMQAFWVRVNTSSDGTEELNFTNDMRYHKSSNLLKAPASKTSLNQIIRIQVNGNGIADESVIYFNSNAANGYDSFDSPKMMNGATSVVPDIYTTEGTEQLVINGKNNIPYNTDIHLFFRANASTASTFSLKANEISNFEDETPVYIRNNMTGEQQLISDGSTFTFDPATATSNPAFSLIIKAPGTTTELINNSAENILVYANANRQLTVTVPDLSKSGTLSVFNALGQKLYNSIITKTTTVIDNSLIPGAYVVRINNITRKVIVK